MKVNIIDGDTLIYLTTYNKKDSPPKSLEDCYRDIDSLLDNIFQATKTTHYILYLTIGKNFRYTIDPSYKANRVKLEKPSFFYEVRQYLIDKYNAISNEFYESDDLCLTSYNLLKKDGIDCFISSPDKDIKMLNLPVYDYKKLVWTYTSEEQAIYHFAVDLIAGQSGDGLKGLENKGIKFAEKFLKDLHPEDYIPNILKEYISQYGEYQGINYFQKMYNCLFILDNIPNFVIPNLKEIQKYEI